MTAGAVPPAADAPAALRTAVFRWACRLDVAATKAGNVSWASPGHGMSAAMFVASGDAASGPLGAPGAPVGRRIEGAVKASWAVAQCNTNLGILLLCAPLLAAAERLERLPSPANALREALAQVLVQLDVNDAQAAYRAIAAAAPGGLGRSEEADVHSPPQIALREAMRLAADRDQIAREYAEGFPVVFELALPAFAGAWTAGASPRAAMLRAYLAVLADQPDSHIVRKHGRALAHSVMAEARPWWQRVQQGRVVDTDPRYLAWDTSLKQRGINPGTSADLSVAAALTAGLCLPGVQAAALQGLGAERPDAG